MAEVLVLVEHLDGNVKKVTYELLALAKRIGEPAAVLVGSGADAAIPGLAEHGAATVYVADAAELTAHPVAPKAEVLAKLVAEKSPAAVLVPSTAEGKEVAARLAIKTNSGIITDAVDVAADGTATQSVFGGATVVKSRVSVGTPIITVRPEQQRRRRSRRPLVPVSMCRSSCPTPPSPPGSPSVSSRPRVDVRTWLRLRLWSPVVEESVARRASA